MNPALPINKRRNDARRTGLLKGGFGPRAGYAGLQSFRARVGRGSQNNYQGFCDHE